MRIKRMLALLIALLCLSGAALPAMAASGSASQEVGVEGGTGKVDLEINVGGTGDLEIVVLYEGEPASDVKVTVGDATQSTGEDGSTTFTGLSIGREYDLMCEREGFYYEGPYTVVPYGEHTSRYVSIFEVQAVRPPAGGGAGGGVGGGGGIGWGGSEEVVEGEEQPLAPAPEESLPVPPEPEPSGPAKRPAGPNQPEIEDTSVPEDSGEMPPIITQAPTGEDRVEITPGMVAESAETGADIRVEFQNEDGGTIMVTLPAFDEHDRSLTADTELWVERIENGMPQFHLISENEPEITVGAYIPHNIIRAARDRQADVRVSFRTADGGAAYSFDAVLKAGFFDSPALDDQDTRVEYDPTAGQGWLVFSNRSRQHSAHSLFATASAFAVASADGWGIKVDIYNPKNSEDLWYEWTFAPEDLEGIEAVRQDMDLFISPSPDKDDPILNQVDEERLRAQYLVVNHHGALPAPARLRVKNMAGFRDGEAITLGYSSDASGTLEPVYTGLRLDEADFVSFQLDHCSSYALTAPLVSMGPILLYAGLAALLLLLLLVCLLRRRPDDRAWMVLFALWKASVDARGALTEAETCQAALEWNRALDEKDRRTMAERDIPSRLRLWVRREAVEKRTETAKDGAERTVYQITEKGAALLELKEPASGPDHNT